MNEMKISSKFERKRRPQTFYTDPKIASKSENKEVVSERLKLTFMYTLPGLITN